ncbi:FAD-dependent monooxygenase [Nonomuraea sp. NPDC004354]
MNNRDILICGAGVAGPTLAYWLSAYGFRPTLVERAPALRTGGYLLDFSGAGYDVAKRMDLLPALSRHAVRVDETQLIGQDGQVKQRIDMRRTLGASSDRYMTIARSDLAKVIYEALDDRVETLFDDRVLALRQDHDGVEVDFARSPSRRFDLVIGCDGLHSHTRRLVFGDEQPFIRYLGYCVAAFIVPDYPDSSNGVYLGYLEPGRQIWCYGLDDGRTAFSMIFAASLAPRFQSRDKAAARPAGPDPPAGRRTDHRRGGRARPRRGRTRRRPTRGRGRPRRTRGHPTGAGPEASREFGGRRLTQDHSARGVCERQRELSCERNRTRGGHGGQRDLERNPALTGFPLVSEPLSLRFSARG